MTCIIFYSLMGGFSLLLICLVLGLIFPRLGHFLFHWHVPDGNYKQEGINTTSHCKYCGKEICEVQGNWLEW